MARYVIGNWKMNLCLKDSADLINTVVKSTRSLESLESEIVIAPPFTTLSTANTLVRDSKVKLAAQNCHFEQSGSFTGEISAEMLRDVGCSFVIVGHSERRVHLGESEEFCAKKALIASKTDLKVIFCIGESKTARSESKTRQVLEEQLKPLLDLNIDSSQLILAYEPVWAIGAAKAASVEVIEDTLEEIKKIWSDSSDTDTPDILYGGSIDPSNFEEILAIPAVSGGLIGGASLKAEKFSQLIEIAG